MDLCCHRIVVPQHIDPRVAHRRAHRGPLPLRRSRMRRLPRFQSSIWLLLCCFLLHRGTRAVRHHTFGPRHLCQALESPKDLVSVRGKDKEQRCLNSRNWPSEILSVVGQRGGSTTAGPRLVISSPSSMATVGGTPTWSDGTWTRIRRTIFPIHGRQEATKFLLIGSIKFFIILALTLTRDTKGT